MIDFWASWCAACMEFEKLMYTDPEVIKESKKFVNIKIDCTNSNDPKIKQLWDKYGVVGLPTIVFVDSDGNVLKDKTITGFINPKEFLRIIKIWSNKMKLKKKIIIFTPIILILVLLTGGGIWFKRKYATSIEMNVPLKEYSQFEYPEDPANRSVHYAQYSNRNLKIVKKIKPISI